MNPLEYRFSFPLPNGLHARPASHLQALANQFDSEIKLFNHRTRQEANAKSVLSLVGADVKSEDLCSLHFSGSDRQRAFDKLTAFLAKDFLSCDEALPTVEVSGETCFIPRSLRAAGLDQYYSGTALNAGIGRGKVVVAGRRRLPGHLLAAKAVDLDREQALFENALETVCQDLGKKVAHNGRGQEHEVLKMHLSILRDQSFVNKVRELLCEKGLTAGQAIAAAEEDFCKPLRVAENLYLRERVLDIEDVCAQVLEAIYGAEFSGQKIQLTEPSICVAENLTPGQFLSLDRRWLQALVLGHAGSTAHTIILARSFNIPTVVGVAQAAALLRQGQEVIVDADHGIVIPEVNAGLDAYYQRALAKTARIQAKLMAFQDREASTTDGRRVEVAANIASAEEAESAFSSGAEGIGLFRTEMLFMDRETPPTEEEQTAIYSAAVRAAAGKPVILRTLDIGGDKPVPYLGLPRETNPFLGYRGVRIYREFSEIVQTQFRAMLRAAEQGPLKVMVPMVSSVEEVQTIKQLLGEARAQLRALNSPAADAPLELGLMLEVPALAFLMPQLCQEVDFFSIGTNDLTQYFLAIDRDNSKLAPLYSAMHPGFLRLLQTLVTQAHAGGKWIGICGQAGEDERLLPVFLGMGVNEISVSAPRVAGVKAAICKASFTRCEELVREVMALGTRGEVEALLDGFQSSQEQSPILTPDLIVLDSDAQTKEAAIKELCDALHLAGRTGKPESVEEEIWLREETYSTGFGGGFAIPHCKSAHLASNSIVVLRTRKEHAGIPWQSLDGNPVQVAVLLAIQEQNAGKEHLKILAHLSRQIMRDEFRDRLRVESDAAELVSFILSKLPQTP